MDGWMDVACRMLTGRWRLSGSKFCDGRATVVEEYRSSNIPSVISESFYPAKENASAVNKITFLSSFFFLYCDVTYDAVVMVIRIFCCNFSSSCTLKQSCLSFSVQIRCMLMTQML